LRLRLQDEARFAHCLEATLQKDPSA